MIKQIISDKESMLKYVQLFKNNVEPGFVESWISKGYAPCDNLVLM